jgi:hypothetical protein
MYIPFSIVLDVSFIGELNLLPDPAAESVALLLTDTVYSVSAVSILIVIECNGLLVESFDCVTSAAIQRYYN